MTLITAVLFVLSLSTSQVLAVCPGFTFAIGNVIRQDGGNNRWNVYDNNCNVVDGLTTNQNPCDQGIFGCSPAPILFVDYTSTITGVHYTCRADSNSGVCGSDVISVCCLLPGASPSTSTTQLPPSSPTVTETTTVSTSLSQPPKTTQSPSTSTTSTSSNPLTTSSSSSSSLIPPPTTPTQNPSTLPDIAGQTTSSLPVNATSAAATTTGSSTISSGAIAGISVGCVVAILLLAVLGVFCYKDRKRARNQEIVFPTPGNYTDDHPQPRFATLSPSFQASIPAHQISHHPAPNWQGSAVPPAPTISDRSTSAWTASDTRSHSHSQSRTTERTSTDAGPFPLPHTSDKLPPPYNNQWSEGRANGVEVGISSNKR